MKIDRIISIIMLLLEREKISATKLAEMFEVTPRTIYRDVETINLADIPIVTYPGVNGGIGIMEEYKIEKKLFTISDVTSLLIGLGSIHSTMTTEAILNTTAKIKGLIPHDQITNIELKSNQIVVDHTPWIGNRKLKVNLDEIKTALYENRLIFFKYSAQNGKKSERKVEPYRLVLKDSSWYLQGYCTTRKDFRTFKVSRIASLEILEDTFVTRNFDYKALKLSHDIKQKSVLVKLLIDESLKDMMTEFCGEENITHSVNGKFIASFPFTEDDYSYGMILRLGDKCECLEPENVRLELIKRIKNLLNIYKND